MLEIRELGEFAIALTQRGGLRAFGGNHGAMKESAILVKHMINALENLMEKVLVTEPGVGTKREIRDVQSNPVKLLND